MADDDLSPTTLILNYLKANNKLRGSGPTGADVRAALEANARDPTLIPGLRSNLPSTPEEDQAAMAAARGGRAPSGGSGAPVTSSAAPTSSGSAPPTLGTSGTFGPGQSPVEGGPLPPQAGNTSAAPPAAVAPPPAAQAAQAATAAAAAPPTTTDGAPPPLPPAANTDGTPVAPAPPAIAQMILNSRNAVGNGFTGLSDFLQKTFQQNPPAPNPPPAPEGPLPPPNPTPWIYDQINKAIGAAKQNMTAQGGRPMTPQQQYGGVPPYTLKPLPSVPQAETMPNEATPPYKAPPPPAPTNVDLLDAKRSQNQNIAMSAYERAMRRATG